MHDLLRPGLDAERFDGVSSMAIALVQELDQPADVRPWRQTGGAIVRDGPQPLLHR